MIASGTTSQSASWLILGILLLLAACGGGGSGGGSDGGGGGGGSSSGHFTLSTQSLSFTGFRNGPPPANQTIQLQLTSAGAAKVGAAWPSAGQPSWATVGINQVSNTTFNVVVIVDANQPAGTYTATLYLGTTDANNTILSQQSVSITFTQKDPIGLSSTVNTHLTAYVATAPQSLPITVSNPDGVGFTVASNAPWVTVPAGAQSPTTSQINSQVDPTGLAPGTYTAAVTATETSDSTVTASLTITLTVTAPTINVSAVTLGGSDGTGAMTSTESITTTPTYSSVAWTATVSSQTGGNWLAVTPGNGTLTSTPATGNFGLAANLSALQAGTYSATVDVGITVQGQTFHQNVPVTLNRSAEKLLVSSYGVAFSKFPSSSLLSRTVTVYDSDGSTTAPWTARSDSSWLTVTASGTTGANAAAGNLVLTANPTGLTADQEHIAVVTVTTTDGVISNQEKIRVGLWVGSADPQPATATLPGTIYSTFVATDPVEPYAFVDQGRTSVAVYNVYTGALITTYSNVGQAVWSMAVSDDGTKQYVEDAQADAIMPVDVATGTVGTPYALTVGLRQYETLAYGKVSDEPMLVSGSGVGIDLATGTVYPTLATPSAWVAISPDGYAVGTLDTGNSGWALKAYRAGYSTLTGHITLSPTGSNNQGANGQDIAATMDAGGNDLFVAVGGGQQALESFSTTGQLVQQFPAAQQFIGNAAVGWNGLTAAGADTVGSPVDLWVYSPSGTQLASFYAPPSNSGLEDRSVRLSGDATRVTAVTYNSTGSIITLSFSSVPSP